MADRQRRTRRGRTGTVRFQVTALATGAVLFVLVAAGAALVIGQRRLLIENLDEGTRQGADSIEASVVDGRLPAALGGFGDDDSVAQVVDAEGRVLAATANMAGRPPIAGVPSRTGPSAARTVGDIPTDSADFRIVSRLVDGPDGPVAIHVAASLGDVDESTGALVVTLVIGIPIVVAVLAALIWWLVGRTLRPVEAIRAEVASIGGTDLHRRIAEVGTDDEIARLARTMNEMLDRVQDANHRQQRFVADASHELRSPLTRIRSELEVDLAHPEGADPAATHRSVLEEATGLQRLVEDLLHLARSDAGAPVPVREPVDVDDIVLDQAKALRAEGRVAVDVTGAAPAQVMGDRAQLARAVANLANNAARHAASSVTFTVVEHNRHAVVTVADDGPGIPADQRERVFERFTRLDEARQGSTGGSGLGLAIARDIAVRHGGTLTLDPDHSPGACFVMVLPRQPAPS